MVKRTWCAWNWGVPSSQCAPRLAKRRCDPSFGVPGARNSRRFRRRRAGLVHSCTLVQTSNPSPCSRIHSASSEPTAPMGNPLIPPQRTLSISSPFSGPSGRASVVNRQAGPGPGPIIRAPRTGSSFSTHCGSGRGSEVLPWPTPPSDSALADEPSRWAAPMPELLICEAPPPPPPPSPPSPPSPFPSLPRATGSPSPRSAPPPPPPPVKSMVMSPLARFRKKATGSKLKSPASRSQINPGVRSAGPGTIPTRSTPIMLKPMRQRDRRSRMSAPAMSHPPTRNDAEAPMETLLRSSAEVSVPSARTMGRSIIARASRWGGSSPASKAASASCRPSTPMCAVLE